MKLIFIDMLNFSSNLYKTEWLDLVFKNRNQTYGAYTLRAQSSLITLRSLMIAAPLFVAVFAGPMIYEHMKPVEDIAPAAATAVIIDLPTPVAPIKEQKKEELPRPEPVKEKLKMVKMPANIKVVKDPVIDQTPPTIDEIKDAVVGPVTQSGTATNLQVVPAEITTGGNGTGTEPAADNGIYDVSSIEAYPEFEGGMKAWARFIQKNLRYPYMAQEQNVQGKVYVSFVVEKDGSVSNVQIVRGIGAGCDEEAMRVIKKSPKWKPGKQNTQSVRVRYNMPISFTLQ